MPNWINNNVCIEGNKKDILAIKELLHTETANGKGMYDNEFDFDKIIPMPEELWLECGSITNDAINAAKTKILPQNMKFPYDVTMPYDKEKTILHNLDDLIALGNKYINNIKKYGCATWYDWACDHWGTKWNSSEARIIESDMNSETNSCIVYEFDTAWHEPTPVFHALSEKFPNIVITVRASYEGNEPWELQCSTIMNGITTETWTEKDNEMYEEYHLDDECD